MLKNGGKNFKEKQDICIVLKCLHENLTHVVVPTYFHEFFDCTNAGGKA